MSFAASVVRATLWARRSAALLLLMLPLQPAQSQALRANSMALMNFTNASLVNASDYAPLEWAIPELIGTRLARNPLLDIVDRRRLQALLDEQDLGASGRADPASAARIGRVLGARYMMFGTFLLDRRNRLRLDARVLDVETSKIVATETIRDVDWNEDVSHVVDSLAERFARNLRLPRRALEMRDSADTAAPARADSAVPGTPEVPAPGRAPAATMAQRDSVAANRLPAVSSTRSSGLVTMGRALRLGTMRDGDRLQAVSMLRAAAIETPSIARDVEDILRRWNASLE
jgi:TolB-like protein